MGIKRILIIILTALLLILLFQIYQLYSQNYKLKANLGGIEGKIGNLSEENGKFMADLEYFSSPENLEKELRSRFNYKKPGEKLIIVVPPKDNLSQ